MFSQIVPIAADVRLTAPILIDSSKTFVPLCQQRLARWQGGAVISGRGIDLVCNTLAASVVEISEKVLVTFKSIDTLTVCIIYD
jgi:hypothetical protein